MATFGCHAVLPEEKQRICTQDATLVLAEKKKDLLHSLSRDAYLPTALAHAYILCRPTSLLGSNAVVITQPKLTPPARYKTEFAPPPSAAYKC